MKRGCGKPAQRPRHRSNEGKPPEIDSASGRDRHRDHSRLLRQHDGAHQGRGAQDRVGQASRERPGAEDPNGLRLAFIVYGTENKPTPEESCRDIKILRPLSELDAGGKGELTRLISQLNVRGTRRLPIR